MFFDDTDDTGTDGGMADTGTITPATDDKDDADGESMSGSM